MDIFKVLMMYMAMTVTGAGQQAPDLTPPPVTPPPIIEQVEITPSPTPAAEVVTKTYTTLRPGNEGAAVKEMQEALIRLGFLDDKADGQYGPKTKAAVSAYQQHCGLKVDGVAGNETLQQLYSADPLASPTPAPSVIPAVMVPVYYMDQDTGSQLFSMDITCYGSTTIYANSNHVPDGYHLVSESSVNITLNDNTPSPASVSFYYSTQPASSPSPTAAPAASPAPAQAQTPAVELSLAGNSVLLNGEAAPLSWYMDEKEQVWLPLKETCALLGWEWQENETCTLMGKEVRFIYDENGLYSMAVDGVLCTEMGLYAEKETYVSLAFLQLLGCPADMTENMPDLFLSV